MPANAAYTAIVRGANSTTGVGLIEVYDLDRTVDSQLANMSTRGLVQTGDNVIIGGLIVLGADPQEVIVRAIGPSLPLAGKLSDPILELHDGNGALVQANDNWRSDQEEEILATLPPANDLESAIVRTLAPGLHRDCARGGQHHWDRLGRSLWAELAELRNGKPPNALCPAVGTSAPTS